MLNTTTMNVFNPLNDSVVFIQNCKRAFESDREQTVRMVKNLNWPNANCTIELYYQFRRNIRYPWLWITFRYPANFPNDCVVPMMESALQYHRDMYVCLRRFCLVRKFLVTMLQAHAPRGIMRTRGIRHRRNANVHEIFAGQPGWRVGTANYEQIYEPGTWVGNIPVFGLA